MLDSYRLIRLFKTSIFYGFLVRFYILWITCEVLASIQKYFTYALIRQLISHIIILRSVLYINQYFDTSVFLFLTWVSI